MTSVKQSAKFDERKRRLSRMITKLIKLYGEPKSELYYTNNWQFIVSVALSAQCTDKKVNEVVRDGGLYKRYKTVNDWAQANPAELQKELSSITFFRNKTKHMIAAAQAIVEGHGGRVPKTREELMALPGVASKTANVILGELYDVWEGIAIDTHVRRFALRFDLVDSANPDVIERELKALVPKKRWKYVNNGLVLYGRYECPAREHDCAAHALTPIWPDAANRWPKADGTWR